jgi:hypothetical protein
MAGKRKSKNEAVWQNGLQRIAEKAQCGQNCSVKIYLQLNLAPACALMAPFATFQAGAAEG